MKTDIINIENIDDDYYIFSKKSCVKRMDSKAFAISHMQNNLKRLAGMAYLTNGFMA